MIHESSLHIIISKQPGESDNWPHAASHLFDTLQTVIGLLYVSVHRRNWVHVDCPLFGLYLPAIKLQRSATETQTRIEARLFLRKLPIPSPPGYCSLVCVYMCVCVWCCCCELSGEILIWQVTSTSESPKDDIPLSSCDTLNKPWRLPWTLPHTFRQDTADDLEGMSDRVWRGGDEQRWRNTHTHRHSVWSPSVCQHYLRKLHETLPSWPVRTLTWHVALCLHYLALM